MYCYSCKKYKPLDNFSKSQRAKANPSTNGNESRGKMASCQLCTPPTNSELTCSLCEKTKSLKEFAKNQRKFHDLARCLDCMYELHTEGEVQRAMDLQYKEVAEMAEYVEEF
ncbi:hypothetical protein K7432_016350 [Basidiobolus ranarum]|uniref:Stc1 domain-containing protein n=1 Tax=Basidiobolus ranarum TaxID=34480 RepID=A0ABR2WEW1_9FUNG